MGYPGQWVAGRPDSRLLAQPAQFDLSVHELSGQFDVRPLVINTLLPYLELDGVVRATAPFYTEYKVAFPSSREAVLAGFDPEQAGFLERLFAAEAYLVDPAAIDAAQTLGGRLRVNALNYLEQQQMIELRVAGVRQGYRMLNCQRT